MNNCLRENKNALVAYFNDGAKPYANDINQRQVGIELEHIIIGSHEIPMVYEGPDGGVREVLEALRVRYPITTTSHGQLIGLARGKSTITIEPSAQLELSSGPFGSLKEAEQTFTTFEKELSCVLEPINAHAITIGYDPYYAALDKPLIPKDRYEYMNTYLSKISQYGPCMMRCSASTQVSIDYTDEADALRKMRLASIAAPLFALMCDNAPIFEGEPRKERCIRTRIWKQIDPIRASTIPGVTRPDYSFADYAEYILGVPAIVTREEDGTNQYSNKTFGKLYKHRLMQKEDIEHAISMVFPDVRLKQYIEIRPADAMPIAYVIAYAALIKGLFYPPESLNMLDELFGDVLRRDIDSAKEEIMAYGYNAIVYGCNVTDLCDGLINIASLGLSNAEKHYLDPLAILVESRHTFADLGGTINPLERLKTIQDVTLNTSADPANNQPANKKSTNTEGSATNSSSTLDTPEQ